MGANVSFLDEINEANGLHNNKYEMVQQMVDAFPRFNLQLLVCQFEANDQRAIAVPTISKNPTFTVLKKYAINLLLPYMANLWRTNIEKQ